MPVLTLPDAHILHSRGWGPGVPASAKFLVELSGEGDLVLYKSGMLGPKKVVWMGIDMLTLQISTDTVQTGGGFFGGGFGVKGAAEGMFEASVLNALTARRREYAMLGVVTTDWQTGSQRELVLGWRNISEDELRRTFASALPAWGKAYADSVLPRVEGITEADAHATYAQLDVITQRGVVPAQEVDRIRQALARVVPPPPPPPGAAADRVSQLKTLAELKDSGALSAEEFELEKKRILSGR